MPACEESKNMSFQAIPYKRLQSPFIPTTSIQKSTRKQTLTSLRPGSDAQMGAAHEEWLSRLGYRNNVLVSKRTKGEEEETLKVMLLPLGAGRTSPVD